METARGKTGLPGLQALLEKGALAGTWILDPRASSFRLKSKVLGLIPVSGFFGEVAGQGIVSGDGTVSGSLMIDAASIDTKNARRDAHLRSADFFDAAGNPGITFTVNAIRPSGQAVAVAGTLAVRGRERPLLFDAAVSAHGEGELWLDAVVKVDRGEFGITWNVLGMVSMTSTVTIHAVFTRG